MGQEDTPPASPNPLDDHQSDEEVLDPNDFEIIDLDAGDSGGEMDTDDEEFGAEGLPPVVEDNADFVFEKHTQSVFSCHTHPRDPNIVASGGEDDIAYLWNPTNGEIVLKCEGFKDSVVHVAFNQDGTYFAAADMSGVIKVWKMSNKTIVFEFETSDISFLQWHSGANVLFCGTHESELWMWKIPSGDSKVFLGHGEHVETAKLLPDGKRMMVGYTDGTMRLFDLKTGDVLHNLTGNAAHESAVSCIDAHSNNIIVLSGGLDGKAKLFNTQSGKPVATFDCGMAAAEGEDEDQRTPAVESVLFAKDPAAGLMVTGTLQGGATVWDINSQVSRHAEYLGYGITKMQWRNGPNSHQLLISTLDGVIKIFDSKQGKIVGKCSGHKESILDFAQTTNGEHLLTASDDKTCRVFNLDKITSQQD